MTIRKHNVSKFKKSHFLKVVRVARYSFSGPMPPKFEHKLRLHKESFGKIAITVVLDKDEKFVMIRVATASELS